MKYLVFFFIVFFNMQFLYSQEFQIDFSQYPDVQFYQKGMLFMDSLNYDKAIECFDKAIEKNSGNTVYFYKRGYAYFYLNLFDSAISNFSHCLKIIPDEPEYYYLLGSCYEKQNENQKALDFFNQAINLDYTDIRFLKSRANIYYKMGFYVLAINEFDNLLLLNPKDGYCYFFRAVCKYKNKDKESACIDWQLAYDNSYTKALEYLNKICNKK